MFESKLVIFPLVLAIGFLLWLGWKIRRAWQSLKLSFNRRKGKKGEERAVKLLRKKGFEVLEEQASFEGNIKVNGQNVQFTVRPDLLVKKNGSIYVAEVKTGHVAAVSDRRTRRQLREYAVLSKQNKVFLVDGEKGLINTIEF